MKKELKKSAVFVIIFCIAFVIGFNSLDAITVEAGERGRMSWIEGSGRFDIYKDNRTGVHYLVYEEGSGYARGIGMCVLVDADGKPLVSK